MNPADFTQHNFLYPQTKYNVPELFQSHTEWLEGGSLRYKINVAMHKLSLSQLKEVLALVEDMGETFVESGEK